MINHDDEFLGIDKNSGFALRVLVLSLPTGLIFALLGMLGILSFSISLTSYICVLFFNTVFLLPMSAEVQQIKKYIQSLSFGTSEDQLLKNMTEKETQELTKAINSMHKFWVDKVEMLENRTLSDAAVLDTLPEPLMMVNQNGTIIGANRAVKQLFKRDLSNCQIETIIDNSAFHAALQKILSQESRYENLRITLDSAHHKSKFHVNLTTLPWFAKGEVVGVVSFYDLKKMLQFEQMQQDFVANASHELRTPLSIISGFIETLQTSAKDDEKVRDKFLRVISEQTSYMSSLIDDLIALSKIEMTVDSLPEDKVSVNMVIKEIKTALSLKMKERGLKMVTTLPRLPQVTGDEKQIKQVLQNLLDNAVKYADENTEIEVQTQKAEAVPEHRFYEVGKGEAVEISVTNKGVVISEDEISRLTERFYRLQEHKNRNIKGTGLGLSIATQIIKRHKGNMIITSVDGVTTFKVYLPVHP